MASSSDIGATASRYTGDPGLGGGGFGFVKLDTQPIEDLGRYVMLYNKSEYDQRQKDAEAAAKEISDYTSYDLTSGIPKDAKLLQDKYDALTAYVRDNPNALDYRNKKEWAEYKRMRNDLENDLQGGKVRNTMFALRQKEIQDEIDPDKRKLMQAELDDEIAATGIRMPLKHSQQYEDKQVKLPTAPELTFDVVKTGPNGVIIRDFSVFNVPKARANGDVFAMGLEDSVDPSTPQGQRNEINRKKNFWIQGADALNSVINAKDQTTGQFLYKKEVVDAAGNKTYVLDESKLSRLPRSLVNLVRETNTYLSETKADIKAGLLKDKFERPLTFGPGALDENDYKEINIDDGLSEEELAMAAQYAAWKGDTYKTKVQETDDAIQRAQIETTRRGQDLADDHFWAGLNKGKEEDYLGADAVIKEISDAINTGQKLDVIEAVNGKKTRTLRKVITIADPNLLKEFGDIDKEGKTTNVPSVVHYDEKNNNLQIVYYKKDSEGNVLMTNGRPNIDREVEMLPSQWLGQVTRRKFPNKDIGGVNELISRVYDKYGRNLKKMATEYTGGASITTGTKETESSSTGGKTKKRVYKGLDDNGNAIFVEE